MVRVLGFINNCLNGRTNTYLLCSEHVLKIGVPNQPGVLV